MVGGVCASIARRFRLDASLVRVVFVLAALAAGLGLVAYVVGWIVIPEE